MTRILLVFAAAIAAAVSPAARAAEVVMTTTLGEMTIELFPDRAPETVANFRAYVESGFFEGTIFHRVIPDFVIQGGGFTPEMRQKETRPPIKNEAENGLKNLKYTLSMARTSDPHSATSQFFINLKDNAFLDYGTAQDGWGYAVFAKVTAGTEVVDQIAAGATGRRGGHADVPVEPVVIERAVYRD